MSRYAIFGAQDPHAITPRFDPIDRERRIDPNAPVVEAYLGGRRVMLSQVDPLTLRPGEPRGLTVPLTVSRYQHALDIERGYDPRDWEPTPLVGFGGPGLNEVIQCCPWRLSAPRGLTAYEWGVVEKAIEGSFSGIYSTQSSAMAKTLTMAIASQNQAPGWKQSEFGPAPAVALYSYGCIGSWWGALDPVSQANVINDIYNTDLLRRANPPWASCPRAAVDMMWRPGMQSEYQIQKGPLGVPGVIADACADLRYRTGYLPTTGQGLIDMMTMVGGGSLSPQLQQMVISGGTLFANRSFVIGMEFRRQPDWNKMPETFATLQDLMKVADAMLEEVALIWAPGKGVSIREAVTTGQMDPAQLTQLIQGMMPAALDDFMKQIPNLLQTLPGLLQGSVPMNVTSPINVSRFDGSPSTPPVTGLSVVDQPGVLQNEAPVSAAATSAPDTTLWIALGVMALGGVLLVRGYQTAPR